MADLSQYQDFNNIGSWPLPGKIAFIAIAMVVVLGLGYYFDTSEQLSELDSKAKKQEQLLKLQNKILIRILNRWV